MQRFGHFNGAIKRDGASLGNIVSADITYANNLDWIETIRSDGRIEGADPSIAALTGKIDVRFADTMLMDQALTVGVPGGVIQTRRSWPGRGRKHRMPRQPGGCTRLMIAVHGVKEREADSMPRRIFGTEHTESPFRKWAHLCTSRSRLTASLSSTG